MDVKRFCEISQLSDEVKDLLNRAPSVAIASKIEELQDMACGTKENSSWTVSYELPDGKVIEEAKVVKVKNGISANYLDPYMRRRDPDCMLVADSNETDKVRYNDRFDNSFSDLRKETFEWLASTELAVFAFEMGQDGLGGPALAICPANAGFFAFGLGLLQGITDIESLDEPFKPLSTIFVAPPFRHTHFDGKQIVVHNRAENHEIFSYNLYPGPSAKKGVYGALIELGEKSHSGWVTAHCSAVEVLTPYDNVVTFMHEGASGGGKSEMLQQPHREPDGRLLIGQNTVTSEKRYLEIPRTCDLHPVCDDMGLCHPNLQDDSGKLSLVDAEKGWFIRVDHIEKYGTEPDLEGMTLHPTHPQLFLNVDAVQDSTALIWDHIEDEPGKPCPNPRVVVPRDMVPNVTSQKTTIDIRSFGVRNPPCTKEMPSYGIMGLMHILPPALAWLWRLVAPRGYANPSIVDDGGMSSEGVGSYWPFSTGKRVAQANLLLKQFQDSPMTRYVLTPNQHVGAWKTGFMPQWLVRDYLARRGHARFKEEQITPSRCSLLGYSMQKMRIEGHILPKWFLQVERQPEIGIEAYDKGAEMLTNFFHEQLKQYLEPGLDETGRKIIECCLNGGSVDDYRAFIEEADL